MVKPNVRGGLYFAAAGISHELNGGHRTGAVMKRIGSKPMCPVHKPVVIRLPSDRCSNSAWAKVGAALLKIERIQVVDVAVPGCNVRPVVGKNIR